MARKAVRLYAAAGRQEQSIKSYTVQVLFAMEATASIAVDAESEGEATTKVQELLDDGKLYIDWNAGKDCPFEFDGSTQQDGTILVVVDEEEAS